MTRDGWLLALVTFVVCMLLASPTFYGDGAYLLYWVTQRSAQVSNHVLYGSYTGWFDWLLHFVVPDGFARLTIQSASHAAVGVAFVHAATRELGEGRARALLVTALVAAAPATLAFGSIIELHGPFLAFAGLATWLGARLVTRGAAAAALFGAASGLATGMHATGHLLVGLLGVVVLVERMRRDGRVAMPRWLAHGAIAMAAHFGVLLGIAIAFYTGSPLRAVFVHGGIDSATLPSSIGACMRTAFVNDWLVPLLPLTLALPAAGLVRHARALAIATALASVAYVALTAFALRGLSEHGAYMLPLAWPLALAAVRALGARVGLVLLAAELAIAVPFALRIQDRAGGVPRPDQIAAVTQGHRAGVFVLDASEAVPFLMHDATTPWYPLSVLAARNPEYSRLCAEFDRITSAALGGGLDLFVTRRALDQLSADGVPNGARFLKEHLAARFELVDRACLPMHVFRMVARD